MGAIIDHDMVVNEFVHVNARAIVKVGAKVESVSKLEAGEIMLGSGTAQYWPDELWVKEHKEQFNAEPSFM